MNRTLAHGKNTHNFLQQIIKRAHTKPFDKEEIKVLHSASEEFCAAYYTMTTVAEALSQLESNVTTRCRQNYMSVANDKQRKNNANGFIYLALFGTEIFQRMCQNWLGLSDIASLKACTRDLRNALRTYSVSGAMISFRTNAHLTVCVQDAMPQGEPILSCEQLIGNVRSACGFVAKDDTNNGALVLCTRVIVRRKTGTSRQETQSEVEQESAKFFCGSTQDAWRALKLKHPTETSFSYEDHCQIRGNVVTLCEQNSESVPCTALLRMQKTPSAAVKDCRIIVPHIINAPVASAGATVESTCQLIHKNAMRFDCRLFGKLGPAAPLIWFAASDCKPFNVVYALRVLLQPVEHTLFTLGDVDTQSNHTCRLLDDMAPTFSLAQTTAQCGSSPTCRPAVSQMALPSCIDPNVYQFFGHKDTLQTIRDKYYPTCVSKPLLYQYIRHSRPCLRVACASSNYGAGPFLQLDVLHNGRKLTSHIVNWASVMTRSKRTRRSAGLTARAQSITHKNPLMQLITLDDLFMSGVSADHTPTRTESLLKPDRQLEFFCSGDLGIRDADVGLLHMLQQQIETNADIQKIYTHVCWTDSPTCDESWCDQVLSQSQAAEQRGRVAWTESATRATSVDDRISSLRMLHSLIDDAVHNCPEPHECRVYFVHGPTLCALTVGKDDLKGTTTHATLDHLYTYVKQTLCTAPELHRQLNISCGRSGINTSAQNSLQSADLFDSNGQIGTFRMELRRTSRFDEMDMSADSLAQLADLLSKVRQGLPAINFAGLSHDGAYMQATHKLHPAQLSTGLRGPILLLKVTPWHCVPVEIGKMTIASEDFRETLLPSSMQEFIHAFDAAQKGTTQLVRQDNSGGLSFYVKHSVRSASRSGGVDKQASVRHYVLTSGVSSRGTLTISRTGSAFSDKHLAVKMMSLRTRRDSAAICALKEGMFITPPCIPKTYDADEQSSDAKRWRQA